MYGNVSTGTTDMASNADLLASWAIFGDFSGHADGERRGLDRIGG